MDYKKEFIEFMVMSNVLTFGDFTAKSGRKTPYFINTGNYKTAAQISKLGDYYAACIKNSDIEDLDFLFGPAYKGIPLAVSTAISLYKNHNLNVSYCFNRKEKKDHGEFGDIIGYFPKDGDRGAIIEDVITAGTSIRESVPLLKAAANVNISALVISVDRMEKGTDNKTAMEEIKALYGINTYSIVNILDIIEHLYNREINGRVFIDDNMKNQIHAYLNKYSVINL